MNMPIINIVIANITKIDIKKLEIYVGYDNDKLKPMFIPFDSKIEYNLKIHPEFRAPITDKCIRNEFVDLIAYNNYLNSSLSDYSFIKNIFGFIVLIKK